MQHVMTYRTRYTAEYDYPGALFPESIASPVAEPTLEAVLAAAPTETEGTYFVKDGWYAVDVTKIVEKRYVGDNPEDVHWAGHSRDRVARWVVGEKVHVDDIPDDDQHSILRSNIRGNSSDGFGVKTRDGSRHLASDYDRVLSVAEVTR